MENLDIKHRKEEIERFEKEIDFYCKRLNENIKDFKVVNTCMQEIHNYINRIMALENELEEIKKAA